MEQLVGVDVMPASDNGNGRAWLQCLFHDLAPVPLRTVSPLCGLFGD
jgi:hypothetical protein